MLHPERMNDLFVLPVARAALLSHQWRAAGAPVKDVSAALAAQMLKPIKVLPSTPELLTEALRAQPLCKIPVDQFVLDSLNASGRAQFQDAFTLRDLSCGIIAASFTSIMWKNMDQVSSLRCCTGDIRVCSLHPCLAAVIARACSLRHPETCDSGVASACRDLRTRWCLMQRTSWCGCLCKRWMTCWKGSNSWG